MNSTIAERITSLRKYMRENNISAYITYSTDPHSGEYTPRHWESRKWITGFTGSAGTVVITLNESGLWTDSRYFLQAEEQLKGTEIQLFKEKTANTPSIPQWLNQVLKKGDTIGFDGYTSSFNDINNLKSELLKFGIDSKMVSDPYNIIWNERPSLPEGKPFILDPEFCGENYDKKVRQLRTFLRSNNFDFIIIASLDEIAWILNMRGTDICCNPVFVSYLIISEDNTTLYINSSKLTEHTSRYLSLNNINQKEYEEIERDLKTEYNKRICLSPNINYAIYDIANRNNTVTITQSPTSEYKSIKNDTEIKGFRNAMTRDGVAMVRFLIWLEQNIKTNTLSEITIGEELYKQRSSLEKFRGISFETIAGYNEHGAIVHYEATSLTNARLKAEGLLLIDSGAHYLDGTTDITRTIPLGDITNDQKKDYTLVLKGFIQLAMAEFPEGTCGTQLDILARLAMWKEGVNYGHGTGHGVGHFLNVHEGPHQIRMNHVPYALKPGMTVTNEPGIYRTGKYGIRTENTMLIIKSRSNEYGEFYKFEQLTLCPINTDAILIELMSKEEVTWLNNYHRTVFDKLSQHLTDNEKEWLKSKTSPIKVNN